MGHGVHYLGRVNKLLECYLYRFLCPSLFSSYFMSIFWGESGNVGLEGSRKVHPGGSILGVDSYRISPCAGHFFKKRKGRGVVGQGVEMKTGGRGSGGCKVGEQGVVEMFLVFSVHNEIEVIAEICAAYQHQPLFAVSFLGV